MKPVKYKTILLLSCCIFLFIVVRSLNYIYQMNWSGDQASCGIEALRLFRTHTLTFIGPQISANFEGHFIFQGPIIYYMYMFFLVLGRWDPVVSSYLFVIFCALMCPFLFYGVKKLVNVKAAWIMLLIYSFLPYYINYTRFLWNSTFLFSLIPVLIFFMGVFKEQKEKKATIFLLVSFLLGLLLQFHYQFLAVILALFFYYFLKRKLKPLYIIYFIVGLVIGFSPLIIFELRHQFYHLKTIILFIQNWSQVDRPGGLTMPHYYITVSFLGVLGILGMFGKKIEKLRNIHLIVLVVILCFYALAVNLKQPDAAFWAPTSPWNYLTEKKIYDIIRSTNIKTDFNVANLAYYDTPAVVVKYFMKRDGYEINYDDYYQNKYLFVISEDDKYKTSPAYEVTTFKPHKLLNRWNINSRFDMVLLEKIK